MKLFKIWSFSILSLSVFLMMSCGSDPTCTDGEQNGGETGIDCGGPCISCDSIGIVIPIDTMMEDTMEEMTSCANRLCAQVSGSEFVGEQSTAEDLLGETILIKGITGTTEIGLNYSGLREVGNYDFAQTLANYTEAGTVYEANDTLDGTINFTLFDTANKVISGTFEFTGTNASGTEIQVTNGTFDQLSY